VEDDSDGDRPEGEEAEGDPAVLPHERGRGAAVRPLRLPPPRRAAGTQ
jgi:hypothetical protein